MHSAAPATSPLGSGSRAYSATTNSKVRSTVPAGLPGVPAEGRFEWEVPDYGAVAPLAAVTVGCWPGSVTVHVTGSVVATQ